ncbi:hypothetical protein EMCRGX_G030520 [Ephydatia muelleri]
MVCRRELTSRSPTAAGQRLYGTKGAFSVKQTWDKCSI